MRNERKKLLAKLAYLYYIEEKSQAEIAAETGIYRTTVSRMLAEAKKKGIVKIEINNFDTRLFQLEKYVKEKYRLKGIDIVANVPDESTAELEERLGQSAANLLRALLDDHMNVGFSWGKKSQPVGRTFKSTTFERYSFCSTSWWSQSHPCPISCQYSDL